MKILSVLMLMLFLSSCYYDNEEDLYPSMNSCDTSQVTYQIQVQSIISSSCATPSCHVAGGTGNGNFENYDGLKSKVDNGSFRERVIVQRNMPPNGDLSSCEIEQLRVWLNNGAPNN